jgi:hypothetical protein
MLEQVGAGLAGQSVGHVASRIGHTLGKGDENELRQRKP